MPSSGSYDFSVNRDDLIKASLRVLNVIDANETPPAVQISNAAQTLNMMLKAWASDGLKLFIQKRATVFMQNSKTTYSFGLTGDHATHSYSTTTVKVAAAALATTIDFTTTTGMTASDYIGIILDSGNVHWTTIASVTDPDTAVITTGIPTAAAAGNSVYWYTTKIPRPLDIVHAFIKNGNDDYTIEKYQRDRYWDMSRKNWSSRPTAFYYEPTSPNGNLYVNYQPTDFTETLELVYHRPIEDFDTATDTPDFPQEWYEAVKFGLALREAPSYGRYDKIPELRNLESVAKSMAMNSTSDNIRYVIPTHF
jgi:hypothetical protein